MQVNLKDVGAQNVPPCRLFLNLPPRRVMIYFCQKPKQMGVTEFVLERTWPEKYPKSENLGFVSY